MNTRSPNKKIENRTPPGKALAGFGGSAVGVARIDPEKSYAGVSQLLQQVINDSSSEAWIRSRPRSITPMKASI